MELAALVAEFGRANATTVQKAVSAAAAADLKANVLKASSFHATLGHYQHPKTRTIHSTGLDTDMAVVFDPPTQPGPQLQTIYTEFGPVHFNAPPEWKHKGATRVHRAEGDGTVPGPSANPLTPNVAVSGVEHSAACSDDFQKKNPVTDEEAKAKGHTPKIGRFPFAASGRARWPAARWGVSCPRI